MKKYIINESQLKNVLNDLINEQVRRDAPAYNPTLKRTPKPTVKSYFIGDGKTRIKNIINFLKMGAKYYAPFSSKYGLVMKDRKFRASNINQYHLKLFANILTSPEAYVNNPKYKTQYINATKLLSGLAKASMKTNRGDTVPFYEYFNRLHPNTIDSNVVNTLKSPTQPSKPTELGTAPKKLKWRVNDNFPIKIYDKSIKYITPLQKMIGLPVNQQKGYFGTITLKKLKEKGVIIDPEIGIQSNDEYINAVNTLRGKSNSMGKMASVEIPNFSQNKINRTNLA